MDYCVFSNLIMKNVAKKMPRNIIYTTAWFIISLVSAFNEYIPCTGDFCSLAKDISELTIGDFLQKLVAPTLIWGIAFYIDYIYSLLEYDENKQVERKGTKIVILIGVIVTLGGLGALIKCPEKNLVRWIVLGYFCVMFFVVKFCSLYSIKPKKAQRQRKRVVRV